jgi:two-component system sensor kinase FixL
MTTAFLVLIQLLLGAFQIWNNYQEQLNNLQLKVETQAEFLSSVTAESILFNDFLSLETFMRQASEDDDVVYSVVVDNSEALVTRYLNRDDPLVQEAIAQVDVPQPAAMLPFIRSQPNVMEIRRPIMSEGVQLGEIWLAYSTQNVRDALVSTSLYTVVSITIVSTLLALLTILLMQWLIKRPLDEVTSVAYALAEGDLTRRATIKGDTEVDQLKGTFNLMASRLEATLQDLKQREAEARQLSLVASNTTNLVIITDAAGYIEWVNDSFVTVTGYTQAEVMGQKPGHLLQGEETDQETVAYMREQVAQQLGFWAEVYNYTKAGDGYWVRVEAQPVYDEFGELINFIAIETDITESKIAAQKLEAYAQELERSNRELQEFAYVASHDLQEPLRKIQAFGSRVSSRYGDQLDERGRDYVLRMQNAAARMQELINALLTFSRVTSKGQPFKRIDLQETVKNVLIDLELRIEETQAQIDLADLPEIEADPMQMRQLFQNLLSNALKFVAEDRTPHIQIGCQAAEKMVHITIQDNGIGFDEKYIHKVFDMFERLHGRQEYDGTGVGLTICRRIVERHGGEIRVNSKLNEGTKFTIILPYQHNRYD